jgi:hypothetical protein
MPGPEGPVEVTEKAMDLNQRTAHGNILVANGKYELETTAKTQGDDPMPRVNRTLAFVHSFGGLVHPSASLLTLSAETVMRRAISNNPENEGRAQAGVQVWYQVHEENGKPQSEPIPVDSETCHNNDADDEGDVGMPVWGSPSSIDLNVGEQLTVWFDMSTQAQLSGWNTSGNSKQFDGCDAYGKFMLGSQDDLNRIRYKLYARGSE